MGKKETEHFHDMNNSRRSFIKRAGATAAGLLVAPYLKPSGVFAYNRKLASSYLATVAITNTANTPADSYIYDDAGGGVKQKMKYLLDLLDQNLSGQVSALFSKGKKVAIKINMTGGSGNATNIKLGSYKITEAMWTHPAVIQAVGQYIINAGVNPSDLYIVDSFWDTTWRTPAQQPLLAPTTVLVTWQFKRLWGVMWLILTIPLPRILQPYQREVITITFLRSH